MTLITTQHNKLEKACGVYLQEKMLPALYSSMTSKKISICPYVNTRTEIPDDGIVDFLETPRFASGYTALFNTFGFITESHMLKPFKERVAATYAIEKTILDYTNAHAVEIIEARNTARQACAEKKVFPLQWSLDTTAYEMISFNGYAAKYKTSAVTSRQRLYYDRSSPYEKKIRYYNKYVETVSAEKPVSYIIPQCWRKVIEQLQVNRINMRQLSRDSTIECEVYYLEDYTTSEHAYEGHHLHTNVKVRKEIQLLRFFKGDYIVNVDQPENRFIVETLEPQGVDSYFAWGFFDAVLQEKEYFSSYVFEDMAEKILNENETLKTDFVKKKESDKAFAEDAEAQLYFIYQHSPYFEKSYKRYPIARIIR
jgi:hypothetical protein